MPILLIALLVGYYAVPDISISAITITVSDSHGNKITHDASATFLDAEGNEIVRVELGALPSWDNNIHWWAHSSNPQSLLRPSDAKRATSAIVRAKNCAPVKVPIALTSTYEPPSIMPHGGGSAYMLYEFNRFIYLECGENVDTTTIKEQIGIWPGK